MISETWNSHPFALKRLTDCFVMPQVTPSVPHQLSSSRVDLHSQCLAHSRQSKKRTEWNCRGKEWRLVPSQAGGRVQSIVLPSLACSSSRWVSCVTTSQGWSMVWESPGQGSRRCGLKAQSVPNSLCTLQQVPSSPLDSNLLSVECGIWAKHCWRTILT